MSLHSFWKGSIHFGLVDIRVKLYAATEDQPLEFHLLHKKCRQRIRYQRYCPICEQEVPKEEVVRGYSISKEQQLVLEEEDFEKIESSLFHVVEIAHFVHLSEVDPIYYDRTYYLVPDPASAKAYALLRDAMNVSGMAAIGHVALHEKGRLALLRPIENAIVLETLYYADAVQRPDSLSRDLPGETERGSDEMEMTLKLMNRLSAKFEPGQYKDNHHERILHIIRSRIKEKESGGGEKSGAPTADLRQTLKSSLRRRGRKEKQRIIP
jgi:DNA end-binding protein Ku